MIYLLHIDTSAETAVVALSADGRSLVWKKNEDMRNHAAVLNLMVEEVLSETGIGLSDLHAISVIGGPGSYTGLRIGLATAKAFCYVLDKPLLMHNKLELLCRQTISNTGGKHDYYLTGLPAREKEYFVTLYNNEGVCLQAPKHVFEEELKQLGGGLQGLISVSACLAETLVHLLPDSRLEVAQDQAIVAAFWSKEALRLYHCNSFVSLATAEPWYLKQVYTHK